MRKECGNGVKNGRLPSARKYWNAIAIFETKPLYEKRQINSGATTILSRLVQYPSDARYKANAFHTRSERVSHVERTRFARAANTFRSSCERVSPEKRTRLGPRANAFHTQSARVSVAY